VFSISSGATVSLNNLEIRNGFTVQGAGIYSEGTLTVANSIIDNNTAGRSGLGSGTGNGGGIFNSGTLTVTNSTIANNAAGYSGPGIADYNAGTITVTNSTIANNVGLDSYGAAIYIGGAITLTVTKSTVVGNSDGGIFAGSSPRDNPIVTLTNDLLAQNTGDDYSGAAVVNTSSNNLIQTDNVAIAMRTSSWGTERRKRAIRWTFSQCI
jgi:hypothetical protein